MKVGIKKLAHAEDLALPFYATAGSAGLDLLAAVETEIELLPGARMAVPCGIAIDHGITCLNAPGTIDSDYRGEIKAILINHGTLPFKITRGAKIAQMVIARHEQVELVESESLSDSVRGAGGFGSTGMSAKS